MGYNFNNVKPGDPYYANWCEKRRRSRIRWIGSLALAPITVLIFLGVQFALMRVFEVNTPWGGLVLLPAFLGLWALTAYAADWPCPRCGKPFYWRASLLGGGYWPFADNCLHCGLPEYAPRDESADAPSSTAITAQQPEDAR